MSDHDTLTVTTYAESGAVVLGVESDEAEAAWPMTPEVADELADRLKLAATEARAQKPERVQ